MQRNHPLSFWQRVSVGAGGLVRNRAVLAAVLASLILIPASRLITAADLGNTTVFSQTDGSNTSGTVPTWVESMPPSQVNDSGRALQGALVRFWNRISGTLTSGGSSGIYTLSYSVAPVTYYNGENYSFKANHTNGATGASLNINALGARVVVKPSTNGLISVGASDIATGNHVVVQYDSTADQFAVVSALPTSSGGVTNVATGAGLTGGPVTSTGTISLDEAVSTQTASFVAGTSNHSTLYVVTVSAATASATLPAASAVATGFTVRVKNHSDGKGVTIVRAGSDTIDGQTEIRVPGREEVAVTRISTSEWVVVKRPSHLVGQVVEWTTDTLPEGGWLWVNGATQSRSLHGGLFAVWGTTYGSGDGSTTFTMRDDRGRVKAGQDDMGGVAAASRLTTAGSAVDGATLGASGGVQNVTLTGAQSGLPSHTHTVPSGTHPGAGATILDALSAATVTTSSTGGTAASETHTNTQPTIITNFIVKS